MANRFDLGIDVSRYQDTVDWELVRAAGVKFVFVKSGDDISEDRLFKSHWAKSREVGLLRGVHHFYREGVDPKAQAKFVYELLSRAGDFGELPPALDIEDFYSSTLARDKIKTCLEELEQLFERPPVVYTRVSVRESKIENVSWISHYPLWIAEYPIREWTDDAIEQASTLLPVTLPGWEKWDFWQFTDKAPGRRFGISGPVVDLNFAAEGVLDRLTGSGQRVVSPPGPSTSTSSGTPPPPVSIAPHKAWLYLADASVPEVVETLKLDSPYWLANEQTKAGDLVFVFFTQPVNGLSYIFRALKDPDTDPDPAKLIPYYQWQHGVQLGDKIALPTPIPLSEIQAVPELQNWHLPSTTQGSLQRQNDLTSEGYYSPLRSLIVRKYPQLEAQLHALETQPLPGGTEETPQETPPQVYATPTPFIRLKAWLYMADASDPAQLQVLQERTEVLWGANPNTRTGDLVFMYLTRPETQLAYIFLALEDAQDASERRKTNPDWKWDYSIRLGEKIQLPNPIHWDEIRSAPSLSGWSLQRNVQGAMRRKRDIVEERVYHALRALILGKNPDIQSQLDILERKLIANVDSVVGVILRTHPDAASPEVSRLSHRAEVLLLEGDRARLGQPNVWLHVESVDGLRGYVPAQFLKPPFTEQAITAATSDQPFGVPDALDFQKYAHAFQNLILNSDTQLPLTIGIYGTWGAGKSFLLNLIKAPFRDAPNIHVVEFNAWEYHTHEVVWAGLVRKIIDQLERRVHYEDRFWNRIDRNFWRNVRNLDWRLIPYGLIVLSLVAFALYTAQGDFSALVQIITGLGGILGLLIFLQNVFNAPISRWVVNLFARSEYGQSIGYMEEIKSDIDALRDLLPPETKVLVMIDDLDRVPPEKVVDVLEAIKLLLDFPIFIVFLGIDARVVTRAVEERYKGILKDVGVSGYEYLDKIVQIPFNIPRPSPTDIRRFLQKQFNPQADIPSLEETTPPPREQQPPPAREPTPAGDGTEPLPRPIPGQDEDHLAADERKALPPNAGQTPQPPREEDQRKDPDGQFRAQERETRSVAFLADEQNAFDAYADYLIPNPRHIKRLLNVYRLVRALVDDEPYLAASPRYLIKWLILNMQWPFTIQRMMWGFQIGFDTPNMQARRTKMNAAEQTASDEAPLLQKLYWYRMGNPNTRGDDALSQLSQAVVEKRNQLDWNNDSLLHLLSNETPEDQIDADMLQKLRRYTTAFHPALDESIWELVVADVE